MSLALVKSIRARTNLGLSAISKAIQTLQTDNEEDIIKYLREQGLLKVQARQDRETNQGRIESYIHDGKLGVLIEVKCETDFVSRGDDFVQLCKDLALHIAANQPKFVSESEVDEEFIQKELEIAREQLRNDGKPENMIEKILDGKRNSIVKDFSLVSQPFLKNPEITVADLLSEVSQKTGEKIMVTRFVIFSLNS